MPASRPLNKALPQKARAREEYNKIPNRPKEDDPNRYTKQPHEYGDILISGRKLGGVLQRDLVYWIERHTWGTNTSKKTGVITRPEWAKLSLANFAKLCGGVEPKNVAIALADLETRGIVKARERTGCGATTAKMYKLTPDKWKAAKPYKEPEKADAKKPAEAEASDLESTVAPGRISRPQPLAIRIKDAPAVTVRMVYHSEGFEYPVTFRSRSGANGRVQITATPHHHSERKANTLQSPTTLVQNSTVDSKHLTDFTLAINKITLAVWAKAADAELVNRIVAAAGTATVERFVFIAEKKLYTRGASKKHTSGLLVDLAAEASRADTAQQAIEAQEEARRRAAAPVPVWTHAEADAALAAPADCMPCNGTGNAGTWDKGIFTMFRKPFISCTPCKGTGKEKKRKEVKY